VVLGLETLAQTPRPAAIPFRVAPDLRPSRGRGQTAPLPSLLEGGVRDPPICSKPWKDIVLLSRLRPRSPARE
jgi:hypothetical protein